MGEPKTNCRRCNLAILQRTADKKDGLCAPCHKIASWIPPDDFELSDDVKNRIERRGESQKHYREMAWIFKQSNEDVHAELDEEEARDARFDEWLPRFQEIIAQFRRDRPDVSYKSLTAEERGKQSVFRAEFEEQCRLLSKARIKVLTMPLIAIPTAEQFWPRGKDGIVVVTPEEDSLLKECLNELRQKDIFCPWISHFDWRID